MIIKPIIREDAVTQTGPSRIIDAANTIAPIKNITNAHTHAHVGKPVTAVLFNIVIPSVIFIPPQNVEYIIESYHLLLQFSQLLQLILELPNISPV